MATVNDQRATTPLPEILPLSVRKVAFRIPAVSISQRGEVILQLQLRDDSLTEKAPIASVSFPLQVVAANEPHRITFLSGIDGSVQYYAVHPAQANPDQPQALVLSVHGAGVEAINQARAYSGKSWAHIVAPTNRRPYGYNWEDWGRLDALEVLDLSLKNLNIDPQRIYLTGHSMGGHGTWILGALYPDRFAALGPSAGWLSFYSYRVRRDLNEESPLQKIMKRATLPSRTLELARNYHHHGIYILHGADDDNVPADQSRQMVALLQTFHKDFIYHEQPGEKHWWDLSDEPGADCVDWPPLFDFFARHARPLPPRLRQVDFITPNPGVSSRCYWLGVEAQIKPLIMSRASVRYDPGSHRFCGTTENIARLSIDVGSLSIKTPVTVILDGDSLRQVLVEASTSLYFEKHAAGWRQTQAPAKKQKGPHRYGTFKDAFRNRMVLVYGTHGNHAENEWAFNKARYDAETFWYQGNGSMDVIADDRFDPQAEPDRNVILYGNQDTNSAWKQLLTDSPVVVKNGLVKIGHRKLSGSGFACLFIRPRPGSDIASVGVVSGTGLQGMRLTNNRPYLQPGYAYPDVTVFDDRVVTSGLDGIRVVGFFGNDWSVEAGEFVWNE